VAARALGGAVSDEAGGDDAPSAAPGLLGGHVAHALLAGLAYGSLAWRDRLDELSFRAIGEHGPIVAAGLGLAVGVALAVVLPALRRFLPKLAVVEAEIRRLFATRGEAVIAVSVATGAVAEELLFRMALPDWLGLPSAVAAAAIVNSAVVGWAWLPLGLAHAAGFCLMVEAGFGLLATATASAVANYLMIPRILCRSEA
jgi:membrane protease YdiL (CAAX protease family)